ncbi:tRNA-dihydrouridine(20/20a) synthase [Glycine soja]
MVWHCVGLVWHRHAFLVVVAAAAERGDHGYSLAVSFAPISSNVVKSNKRFTVGISHRNRCSYRLFSTHAQKHQLHEKPGVVARYHLPPWFSVAPMMDWTDHHYRTLARLISKHAWLYTEMLAAETIVHQKDNLDRFLAYSPDQHPIVLQIGGSNIENLAKATELANAYCYDEINLNCGCPSPKVAGHGCFGVSLMLNPKFVAEAMSAIAASTNVPVSVKCRIGVDDHDSYNELCKVSSLSPTKHFIIHSRKALLNGISPAENRSIPPLKYEYFYGLLRDFPDLRFTINGGITSVDEVSAAREAGAHGVMVGRAAYNNPWQILGHVDAAIYGTPSCDLTRRQVLERYLVYGDSVLGKYGHRPTLRDIVKPLLHLFHSEPGNGLWKRKADAAFKNCTTMESFFEETLVAIPDSVLDSPVAEPPPGRDLFANMHNLLPAPYRTREATVIICA